MSDGDGLVQFLLAQYAEEEADALPFRNDQGHVRRWRADEVGGKVRDLGPVPFGLSDVVSVSDTHLAAAHIARWDPARVLADIEAKRRIVEEWRGARAEADAGDLSGKVAAFALMLTLRALALPYADRPGYREEWRPE